MSLVWGRSKEEITVTTSHDVGFERGDSLTLSGLVNHFDMCGKVFVVKRAKGTQCLIGPAGWWDYVMHYAKKFGGWVRWHYYGVVDTLRERIRCLFS